MLNKNNKYLVFITILVISSLAFGQFEISIENQQPPSKPPTGIGPDTGVGHDETQTKILAISQAPAFSTPTNVFDLQFDKYGFTPQSILFTHKNIWVGGQNRDLLLKVDPANGDIIQIVEIGKYGVGVPDLAFDGVHVWALVNQSVVKVRASDGAIIGTYALEFDEYGFTPQSILYAHKNIWVGGQDRDVLLKVDPYSGGIIQVIGLAKYGVGVPDLVFDRHYIYAPVYDALYQVRASDGVIVDTFYYNFDSTPFYPQSLAYDYGSERVWAGGRNRDLAVGINPATGTTQVVQLGKYGVGVPALLYHQNDLWAIVLDQLIQIDLTSATVINQVPLNYDPGFDPISLASDGTSIWIALGSKGILIQF